MPLYEYACTRCEVLYEARRPFDRADDAPACPVCGAAGERQLAVVSIVRGGRWATPAPAGARPAARHGVNCGCCGPRRPPAYAAAGEG